MYLRRLIRTATDIVTSGFEKEDEIEDVLNDAEKNPRSVLVEKITGHLKILKMS